MNKVSRLSREIKGLGQILPRSDFLRWGMLLVLTSPRVLQSGSLGIVDRSFGSSIDFRCAGRQWKVEHTDLGVVREIVAGSCYISGDQLRNAHTILDLGANTGVFTIFALSHAPMAHVTAVEMNSSSISALQDNLLANGLAPRVQVVHALVGSETPDTAQVRRNHSDIAEFDVASWIDSVGYCDFLKCDIEGSEYGLISRKSGWLRKVRRIGLEYHGSWEDGEGLASIIRGHGFRVAQKRHGSLGYLSCERIA